MVAYLAPSVTFNHYVIIIEDSKLLSELLTKQIVIFTGVIKKTRP